MGCPVHGDATPRLMVPMSGLAWLVVAGHDLERWLVHARLGDQLDRYRVAALGSHQLGLSGTGLPVVGQATVRAQR